MEKETIRYKQTHNGLQITLLEWTLKMKNSRTRKIMAMLKSIKQISVALWETKEVSLSKNKMSSLIDDY